MSSLFFNFDVADDGPFESGASIGVGFSNTALLAVSVCGFLFLAFTVYTMMLSRLKSDEELEAEARAEMDHDEYLLRADVATLNRAERRARARAIARRRKAEGGELHGENRPASRKDRQKAVKAAEREERRLLEDARKTQQHVVQESLQKEKRQKEIENARRVDEEKLRRQTEKKTQEDELRQRWSTFLSSSKKTQTVDEFVVVLEQDGVVSIDSVAETFGVSPLAVKCRIDQLIQEKRVIGVFEADGRFVYFREAEVQALMTAMRKEGELSDSAIADLWNTMCGKEHGDKNAATS